MRDTLLTEQIRNYLSKISLSEIEFEKAIAQIEVEYTRDTESFQTTIQNFKAELTKTETTLEKLLDAFLANVLSTGEYAAKKEKILARKLELKEKIKEIEQRGNSWLGLAKDFIISLNKANQLLKNNNTTEMTPFLKNIGSHHLLQNRQYVFKWQPPYNLVAAAPRPLVISRIAAPTRIELVFSP